MVASGSGRRAWIEETGNRGHLLEPDEIVLPIIKEMHDWFGTPAWYKEPSK